MKRTPRAHTLAVLLTQKMLGDNCKATDFAKTLGVSQSYFSELLSGDKEFSKLRIGVLRNIAGHLEIPAVVCFMLAGTVHPSDFINNPEKVEKALSDAIREQLKLPEGIEVSQLSFELKLVLLAVLGTREMRTHLETILRQAMRGVVKSNQSGL